MMVNQYLVVVFVAMVMFFSSLTMASPVDTYVFQDKVTEIRFNALNKELRCPKCQNQNLADSNSPIAADLRREVYELLQQGKADIEIVDFMVARYGEFVLYRPRVSSLTYILWYGPAGLLFVGVIVVVIILRRKPLKKAQQTLNAAQKNKLDQILKNK
jgi:cytochrome c-type biogenesis protein CcmH